MIAARRPITARIVHRFLKLALRFWPEESRHWGQALAAEFHEIEQPFEAFWWALGGLMLFIRASASHVLVWLRLPVGSRFSAASLPGEAGAPLRPKRSRLFTLAILVASAMLLFLPQSREAISTVRASWNGYRGYPSDARALQKLAARAEKERDANTLGFVALATPDAKEAVMLTDRAVTIDPSLVWIYACRTDHSEFTPPSKDDLARLLAADADNAFPELLAARTVSEPLLQSFLLHRMQAPGYVDALLSANPDWAAHMDRAFRSSRYDAYFTRHWQLVREAWNRNASLSPSLAFVSLWAHPLPDWFSIKSYADILVQKTHEASGAGYAEQARSLLQEVDSFGRRMTNQSETDSEKLLGLDLSRRATRELRDLYEGTGQKNESLEAAKQLQQIEERRVSLLHSFRRMEETRLRALERSGLRVQLSAVLGLLLAVLVAICLIALELRRGRMSDHRMRLRRAICFAADWLPLALLLACAALLWSFQPYAQILHSARNLTFAPEAWQVLHFEGLYTLTSALGALEEPFTPLHFWQAFTCALVALALFIPVRGVLRVKRA